MPALNTIANLCYLINEENEVLLQFKRQGFGQGKWNGPGGKVEPGETIEQAVRREVREETNLEVLTMTKVGELEFMFKNQADWNQVVHVFLCREYRGRKKASAEGELRWFKIEKLPFAKMWVDDIYWLKDALAGKYVKMRFYFDRQAKLLNYEKL